MLERQVAALMGHLRVLIVALVHHVGVGQVRIVGVVHLHVLVLGPHIVVPIIQLKMLRLGMLKRLVLMLLGLLLLIHQGVETDEVVVVFTARLLSD